MRKTLLFAAALCLASSVMAQNSPATQNGISTLAESTATGATVDDPIEMVEGENTVPAAAGKYYFIFHPTKIGYLNITSENVLTDGQVKIYGTKIHAQTENAYGLKGSSAVGSFDVRMEVPYAVASTNYYIVIDKKTATDKADTFTLKMENYQPGQTEETALTLSGEAEKLTLAEAKGTYYYKMDVPANTKKYIVVNGPETLNSSSSVTFYIKDSSSFSNPTMKNGELKTDLLNETDKTYILKVVSAEETPMSLNVSYEDIQEGALIKLPKPAALGKNTIDIDAESEYFSYTATMDGKLTVEVNDNAEVSFPSGPGKYDQDYDDIAIGNAYSVLVYKGESYLIKVTGMKKDETFTLTESTLQPGESVETAINIEGNSYTFGKDVTNLWLKYEVPTDGVIDISCDAPYTGKGSINVSKNGDEAKEILENGAYKGKVFANKGDELYIYVIMEEGEDISGKTLTFTSRDFLPGEDYTAPIVLEKGQSTDIATNTWIKCPLSKGENSLYFVSYVSFNLYKSLNDVKMGETTYIPTEEEELPNGEFISKLKVPMEEAGDIYIKITYAEGEAKLVYDEPTTGISNIEAAQQDGKAAIYNLNGMKMNHINGNGVYIIKSNGQTKKIVVKK